MIRGTRTISIETFLEKILPHMGRVEDALLSDFRECVELERDYIVIFKDYEITVKLEDVKTYMESHGGQLAPGVVPEVIDAFLPDDKPKEPETPAEVEARAIAAKHPKESPPAPRGRPKKSPQEPEGIEF